MVSSSRAGGKVASLKNRLGMMYVGNNIVFSNGDYNITLDSMQVVHYADFIIEIDGYAPL